MVSEGLKEAACPIILGIDPGLASTGYAVICAGAYVDSGVALTKPKDGSTLARIQRQFQTIAERCRTYGVTHVSMERWCYQGISSTATYDTNQVIGIFCALSFVPPYPKIYTHDPLQWGKQLTGRARRSKKDVQAVVSMRLGIRLTDNVGGHQSDALGLALVLEDQLKMRHVP